MALTNTERQKKYRERQLLNNKEAYDKKISLKMKKHYRKLKNEEIIINDNKEKIQEIENNIINKDEKEDKEFILIQLKKELIL